MRFKEYIIERTMDFNKALEIFGMSATEINDKLALKKKYRDLAMQHHPDKGGDVRMAQDVNDAYAILAKTKTSSAKGVDWDSIDAKYKQAAVQVKTALMSNFRPEVFTQYFKDMSGYDFHYDLKRVYPAENARRPDTAGFDVEFFTKDRSTVFTLNVHAPVHDIVYPKAVLATGNISYKLYTTAYGFHLNKKQKLSQSDWQSTNDHSFFRKPEQLFPKKKMKDIFSGKTSKRAFKKRDMYTFFKNKMKARINGDDVVIDLGEGYSLYIYRMTFNRQPFWGTNGIYLSPMGDPNKNFGSRVAMAATVTFSEEEETAKIFEKIQKEVQKVKGEAKIKKTNQLLKLAHEAYKKAKGI